MIFRGFRSIGIRDFLMKELLWPSVLYWVIAVLGLLLITLLVRRVNRKGKPGVPFLRQESRRFLIVRLVCLLVLSWLAFSGVRDGSSPEMLKYYTYLSNILVCVTLTVQAALCVLRLLGAQAILPAAVRGWVTLSIFFTFLTVFLVLSPFSAPSDWLDARIHYLVPLLTVADWVIFEPHGALRWYHPLYWLFTPILYFAYVLALVQLGIRFNSNRFPYFFMNVRTLGWGGVLSILLMLAAVFLAVGYAMVAFDRRRDIARYFKKRKHRD